MKKVIVKIIILILCITCIIGIWMFRKHQINLIDDSEVIGVTDLNEIDAEIPEVENTEEIIVPIEENQNKDEENTVVNEVKKADVKVVEQPKTETKLTSTQTNKTTASTNNSSASKNNTSSTKKTTTNNTEKVTTNNQSTNSNKTESSKVEQPKAQTTTPVGTPKTEPTPAPKSDKCYEGGSKHVAGSGAYEHGYYNSYKEAWNALTVYMEDMISGNYYIDECACGKFYFYVRED